MALFYCSFDFDPVVLCGEPVLFNQSSISAYVTDQQLYYGSSIAYACNTGYRVPSGVDVYTSYCDMFGQWNVTEELCDS